jgi:DNA polymerase V
LQLGAHHLTVFFQTSEHDIGSPQRFVSTVVTLPEAMSDTLVFAKAASWAARRVWRDGYRYSKAGIMTVDLVP